MSVVLSVINPTIPRFSFSDLRFVVPNSANRIANAFFAWSPIGFRFNAKNPVWLAYSAD